MKLIKKLLLFLLVGMAVSAKPEQEVHLATQAFEMQESYIHFPIYYGLGGNKNGLTGKVETAGYCQKLVVFKDNIEIGRYILIDGQPVCVWIGSDYCKFAFGTSTEFRRDFDFKENVVNVIVMGRLVFDVNDKSFYFNNQKLSIYSYDDNYGSSTIEKGGMYIKKLDITLEGERSYKFLQYIANQIMENDDKNCFRAHSQINMGNKLKKQLFVNIKKQKYLDLPTYFHIIIEVADICHRVGPIF